METVNDRKLRDRYIRERGVMEYFSICKPNFLLMHYFPHELLTNPFSPSQYLQFVVDGELLLYDMPDEESTVTIQTSFNDVQLLGEMELLDTQFTPFFVEARTDVYTLVIYLSQYGELLQKDPIFFFFFCRNLANKLNGAVVNSRHLPLRQKVELSLQHAEEDEEFTNISHLAKTLNVSSRQLLRVLKELCDKGVLEHVGKGRYRVLRRP